MPPNYKEATYQEVTLWMDNTPVEYVPNGKRAGTMSYDRYNAYAVAKTVGEALRLGSKPEDLLNDFQKGLLKPTGGPKREKALDIMAIQDINELTEVDLLLARWGYHEGQAEIGKEGMNEEQAAAWRAKISDRYKKLRKVLMARKHGVKVEEVKQGSWCETPKMQVERMLANKEAGRILEAARQEGRKVRDEEVIRVLRLWKFRKNYDTEKDKSEDQNCIFSDTFGYLRAPEGRHVVTIQTREYPQVTQLLCQSLKDNRPDGVGIDWPFTTITVQLSYTAPRHREKANSGPSVVKLLGDFTGGRFQYWPEDDRSTKVEDLLYSDKVVLDAHGKAVVFDGRRCHAVEPYEGEERFSIVYFICNGYGSTPQDIKDSLTQAGINFPTAESVEYVTKFLPAPKGYPHAKLRRPVRPQGDKPASSTAASEGAAASKKGKIGSFFKSVAKKAKAKGTPRPRMLARPRGDKKPVTSPAAFEAAAAAAFQKRKMDSAFQPDARTPVKRRLRTSPSVEPESSSKRAEIPSLRSTPFDVGMACNLTGLKTMEDLNAKEVVCIRYNPDNDKWMVSGKAFGGGLKQVGSDNLVPANGQETQRQQHGTTILEQMRLEQMRFGTTMLAAAVAALQPQTADVVEDLS